MDKKALEAAIGLKEKKGGEIIIISMTPPSVISFLLKKRWAIGYEKERQKWCVEAIVTRSDHGQFALRLADGMEEITFLD